jgi:hypothetical protein
VGATWASPSRAESRARAAARRPPGGGPPRPGPPAAGGPASGQWRPATLFPDSAAPREPREVPGDPAVMRDLLYEVVASGTGTAADLPGEPVGGKTGSAEFGSGDPPDTHAWFIGFRDALAFAVLVEGGGAGGEVAAPVAAAFLERLD